MTTKLCPLKEPNICYICGLSMSWDDAELDHIIPLSKGGKTTIGNLQWAHRACNRMKHDMLFNDFLTLIKDIIKHHSCW